MSTFYTEMREENELLEVPQTSTLFVSPGTSLVLLGVSSC